MRKRIHFHVIALAVLGLVAVGFGFYQVYASVYDTFKKQGNIKSVSEANEESTIAGLKYTLMLQDKDSDKDGLNDYDEQYIYGTSPYVADTDSDGISDRTELEQGTDPLCHKLQDCTGGSITIPATRTTALEAEVNVPVVPEAPTDKPALPADVAAELNNVTPAEIRSFLKESGFPEAQLEGITDDQLMVTWKEVMKNQSSGD